MVSSTSNTLFRNDRNAQPCAAANGRDCHARCFRHHLAALHAASAPSSAVAELGAVSRFFAPCKFQITNHTNTMKQHILRAAIVGILLTVISTSSIVLRAEDQAAVVPQAQLAKDLIGTWILVGEPGKVEEPPASGGRLKFFTGWHWIITQADPKTGVTIYHHGGTYTLNGNEYAETVEYANESTSNLIKQTFKFTIKVEGDTMTQVGIGNPWTEVWKRVKQ